MEFPTLYSRDKSGRIRFWNLKVQNNTIVRTWGLEGGKITSTSKFIEKGKNIGKTNETSAQEQALLEAKSIFKKQKDDGYLESREEAVKAVHIFPMLAHKWEEKQKHISEPFWIQPKLDGVRMLATRGCVISRSGKPILHLDHIVKEVDSILKPGQYLDGELYSHEHSFEDITSMCRMTLQESADAKDLTLLKYHVYDYFEIDNLDETFVDRFAKLNSIRKKHKLTHIKFVPTNQLAKKSDLKEAHNAYIEHGYEGTMIREAHSGYTLNERSNGLLKYKDFATEEYKIVDAVEATGRDKGTVVWICTNGTQNFSVRPRGTQEVRAKMLNEKDKYIGKMLTVQYQNLTNTGVPRFPVGLVVRDYE